MTRERARSITRLFVTLVTCALLAPAVSTIASAEQRPPGARSRVSRARAARDLTSPQFKVDANGHVVPDVRAEAAIIYSPITGQVLWEENSQDQRSIASITKVMTALVFLESHPSLSDEITIDRRDVVAASTTYLRSRERISGEDLVHLLLIASDNAAARAIARVSPRGSAGFVERMTEKARELGLESTRFADPSGLHADNLSSAYDVSRLIAYAGGNDFIAAVMRKPTHTFRTSRRRVTIRNTNRLVGGDVDVLGGKTGFIRAAGYCLATLLQLPQGDLVAVVVLGARSNTARFWETRHLMNWLSARAQWLVSGHPSGLPQ